MNVLVTGGTGFVMSNVARRLLESDPQASVVILDRDPYFGIVVDFFKPVSERLRYVQGDVRDREVLNEVSAAHDITHVVHAAAVTPSGEREKADPAGIVDVNLGGTLSVLEWARGLPGLQRFIQVSSGAVYGLPLPDSPEAPQPETGPFNPPELYAVTKYAGELIARRYGDLFGFDVRRVRFAGVFGPMERPTSARASMSFPYQMMRAYIEKRPFRTTEATLQAGGDYLSAEDIGGALAALLHKPALSHDVYNVAFGRFTLAPEWFSAFKAAAPDFEVEVVSDARDADATLNPAERRARWNAYAIDRLTQEVNWQPRPLAEQFAGYVRWVREDAEVRCPALERRIEIRE